MDAVSNQKDTRSVPHWGHRSFPERTHKANTSEVLAILLHSRTPDAPKPFTFLPQDP